VKFIQKAYTPGMRREFDSVVFATYGLGPSQGHFAIARFQIAEKILIELPEHLRTVSLVVVDGPFTAWDPYGASGNAMFGSAKHTNHWSSTDPDERPPARYEELLNKPAFAPVSFTHFERMRADASDVAPEVADARYLGSRFTMRVVEDSPEDDKRVLYVESGEPGELHIFSGKVVGAVKAARLVCEQLSAYA
jgi:hypothetical protein